MENKKNQNQFGQICAIANKIRKERGISQKEAFAIAKQELNNAEKSSSNVITKEAFTKMLEDGSVKFTYRNRKGIQHTTKGTLCTKLLPMRNNVLGRKYTNDPECVAFYDRIHGVYCTVKVCDIIQIF